MSTIAEELKKCHEMTAKVLKRSLMVYPRETFSFHFILKDPSTREKVRRHLSQKARANKVIEKQEYEKVLMKHLKVSEINLLGKLKAAVIRGDLDSANSLLGSISVPQVVTTQDDVLLFVNLIFGRWNVDCRKQMLELLVKKGLDLTVRTQRGYNILNHFLSFYADNEDVDLVDIVRLCLDSGCEMKDSTGLTALSSAFLLRRKDLIEYLVLEKGADVNRKSEDLAPSPLHLAIQIFHGEDARDVIGLLVSKGADIEERAGSYGKTPLQVAREHKNDVAAECLIEMGARDFKKMRRKKIILFHDE